MLIVLMYHRVGSGKHANSLEMLSSHFDYLQSHFPIILPGDEIKKTSVCLTFDDASYDFYHYVFPLLKEKNMRSLLGIPVGYIIEKSSLPKEKRLAIPYTLAMQEEFIQEAPFCSWEEIREMISSGYVQAASHSYTHANCTFDFVNLEREVLLSKKILEEKLPQAITSFIYPFGRYSHRVESVVKQHYTYSFRIGSAANISWHAKGPLYRISADHLDSPSRILSFPKRFSYEFKRIWSL